MLARPEVTVLAMGIALVAFSGGLIVGWVWRSIRFGLDRDCANPAHPRDEWCAKCDRRVRPDRSGSRRRDPAGGPTL